MKVHTYFMDQYGGTLTPDLRSGTFTTNNVTIRLTTGSDTTLALSPEEISRMVEQIKQRLIEQAWRYNKDPEGDDPPSGP